MYNRQTTLTARYTIHSAAAAAHHITAQHSSPHTCDDNDPDACVGAVTDGGCHLGAWGVTQPRQTQEHHVVLNLRVPGRTAGTQAACNMLITEQVLPTAGSCRGLLCKCMMNRRRLANRVWASAEVCATCGKHAAGATLGATAPHTLAGNQCCQARGLGDELQLGHNCSQPKWRCLLGHVCQQLGGSGACRHSAVKLGQLRGQLLPAARNNDR